MTKVKNNESKPEKLKKTAKKSINKVKHEILKQNTPQNDSNPAIKKKKKILAKEVNIAPSSSTDNEVKPKILDAKALAKIEKKKAKKLAQKLKKKEHKAQENVNVNTPKTNGQQNVVKKEKMKNSPKKSDDIKERIPKDAASGLATVFVGNLPVTTKRIQIAKLFAKYGGVKGIRLRTASGQILFKHKQRKKAGTLNAYVVLSNAEAAQKALELNGVEFKDGHHLRITPSDAQKTQSNQDPKRTVFIGNLKYTANEKNLHEIFSNCGEIDYIRCLGDGKNGCKGVAYVCFKSAEAVGLALELNETLLDERPIHVERYSTKKLGAKEARDKQALITQKPKASGAKKRIDDNNKNIAKNGKANNKAEKKKKSDFHGVKSAGINKKKYNKKLSSEMRSLAKKIAPKIQHD